MVLILELKTTQTPAIKVLTDTLNSLLTDVNFVFHPKVIEPENENTPVQTGGLIIKEINKTGTILVYVRLDADKFDTYNYNYHKNKITVGINLNNLLKCLKCMSNYDAMTWAIDSDDINKLIITIEFFYRDIKDIIFPRFRDSIIILKIVMEIYFYHHDPLIVMANTHKKKKSRRQNKQNKMNSNKINKTK